MQYVLLGMQIGLCVRGFQNLAYIYSVISNASKKRKARKKILEAYDKVIGDLS